MGRERPRDIGRDGVRDRKRITEREIKGELEEIKRY